MADEPIDSRLITDAALAKSILPMFVPHFRGRVQTNETEPRPVLFKLYPTTGSRAKKKSTSGALKFRFGCADSPGKQTHYCGVQSTVVFVPELDGGMYGTIAMCESLKRLEVRMARHCDAHGVAHLRYTMR